MSYEKVHFEIVFKNSQFFLDTHKRLIFKTFKFVKILLPKQ